MKPETLARFVNLAEDALGAEALLASDQFFAPKDRMLRRAEPLFRPGTYDEHGQWMDGWETRRRRDGSHDWCIVQLAYPGVVRFVDLDTRFFTGNYAPQASIDATSHADPSDADAEWTEILSARALVGNDHNLFAVTDESCWRHLRLNIYPDGGIARFRVYGEVRPDWASVGKDEVVDLAAVESGGLAILANDQHYGHIHNLNRPGRGADMGDGWETRRRREPGFDWVILKLGHPGLIRVIEIDTAHFRGNYPDRVSVNAAMVGRSADDGVAALAMHWPCLLSEQPLQPDRQHRFSSELASIGEVSHVRVNLHPDGGLSRVRVYGTIGGVTSCS